MNYIEQIISTVRGQGHKFIGYLEVSIPITVCHLTYEAKDDTPYYFLDRGIMTIISKMDNSYDMDMSLYAALTGFEVSFIKYRVKALLDDNYIVLSQQYHYVITDKGRHHFFDNDEKTDREYDYEYVCNGIDLSPLPDVFNSEKRMEYVKGRKNTLAQHMPIEKDLIGEKIMSRLNKYTVFQKKVIGIRDDAHGFNFVDSTNVQYSAFIVFSLYNKSLYKKLYYENQEIDIASFKGIVSRFKFVFNNIRIKLLKFPIPKKAHTEQRFHV